MVALAEYVSYPSSASKNPRGSLFTASRVCGFTLTKYFPTTAVASRSTFPLENSLPMNPLEFSSAI